MRQPSRSLVHVDDICTVGLKSRCDRFRDELVRLVQVKTSRELRWFGNCHYSWDRERGTLTISQKTFAYELGKMFQVISEQNVPLRVGVKLEKFDDDKLVENWACRVLVASLMWLSTSTRPDILNVVGTVAR